MKEAKIKQLFKLIGDHFLGYGVATEAIDKWNNDTEFQSKLVEVISDSFKTRTKKAVPENKRPKNSFLEYCADHRQKVKDSLVDQSAAAVSRKLGDDWKKATEDVKKPYIDLAKSNLDEYNAKKELNPSSKAENKPSDMPVKNLNIWQIFCREFKDQVTTTPKQPELRRMWNELKISKAEKDIETYKELERTAAEEKEVYKQELASYKDRTGWKPTPKPKKDKDAPPRAKSMFDIYRDNQLPGLKASHGKEAMAQMRADWNIFKTQEGILQEEYKRLAKEDKERHTNAMKIYKAKTDASARTDDETPADEEAEAMAKIKAEAEAKAKAEALAAAEEATANAEALAAAEEAAKAKETERAAKIKPKASKKGKTKPPSLSAAEKEEADAKIKAAEKEEADAKIKAAEKAKADKKAKTEAKTKADKKATAEAKTKADKKAKAEKAADLAVKAAAAAAEALADADEEPEDDEDPDLEDDEGLEGDEGLGLEDDEGLEGDEGLGLEDDEGLEGDEGLGLEDDENLEGDEGLSDDDDDDEKDVDERILSLMD